MKEIRIHGRGGQGAVTAAEIIVYAAVQDDMYASCFPYFGFEKKGGPVAAFSRIDDKKIREKCQVYNPHCIIVIDSTLLGSVDVFKGLREDGILIINCKNIEDIELPDSVKTVGWLDANAISNEIFGKTLPNTILLGAFAKTTGWVGVDKIIERSQEIWGPKNALAVQQGCDDVRIIKRG